MKRLFFIGIVLAGILPFFAVTQTTHAVDVLNGVCQNADQSNPPAVCGDNAANSGTNPIFGRSGVMTEIINILSLIVGIAAVFGIIVSGLMMVVANGDSGKVSTARSSILYCLVGLVVAAVAQVIVAFVLNKL